METSTFQQLLADQQAFFWSGATLSYRFRKQQLQRLLALVETNEEAIAAALKSDLRKSFTEAYTTEIGVVIQELRFYLKHLRKFMSPKKLRTPLIHFRATSYALPTPHGNTLIIAPWNYPFMLALRPAIGALAAGNTAIIKPGEAALAVSALLEQLINENFPENYLKVVQTDAAGAAALVQEPFDFIFFTGSSAIGRKVYTAAAQNLTPVALELGGKNPCIIDNDINLEVTAARLVWGKFTNAGQTCVSPDYIFVHESIRQELIAAIIGNLEKFYGTNPRISDNYGRIINETHLNRLEKLLTDCEIVHGGRIDKSDLYIEPTVVTCSNPQADIWQEEIFGPLMLIVPYNDIEQVLTTIQQQPTPLVAYLFSNNSSLAKRLSGHINSGDFVVNDVVVHFGDIFMPVGGKGNSGFGKYQGKASFEVFSHFKSIYHKKFYPDITLRYPPYSKKRSALFRKLFELSYRR